MRDVTKLMLGYRECARHVWNAYLAGSVDLEDAEETFGRLQQLLFRGLVSSQIEFWSAGDVVFIVPNRSMPLLVKREVPNGNIYWDETQAPSKEGDSIKLIFLAYYDCSDEPVKDFRFYRCLIEEFSANPQYQQREALIDGTYAKAFVEPGRGASSV